MLYVIVYDIEPDDIRADIAKVLEGYGQRVQKSVFECQLDARTLAELTERLRKALERPDFGNLRVYRVCADCRGASFGLGDVAGTFDAEPCIII